MKPTPQLLVAVFLGGALGSVLRMSLGLLIPSVFALALVNLAGAAFLGYVNGNAAGGGSLFATDGRRAFWGAGFAGGFTTMSGLAQVFTLQLLYGQALLASAYIVAQFVFGVALYLLAFRVASHTPSGPTKDVAE